MERENGMFVLVDTPKSPSGGATHAGVDILEDARGPAMPLEWRHVTVHTPGKPSKTQGESGQRIMDAVSGFAVPGELLAVMGQPGVGKTTLLHLLAGQSQAAQSAETSVTISGEPMTKLLAQRYTALVQPEDIFLDTLTVRDHLLFRARFHRTHTQHSKQERQLRVDHVLQDNGLDEVRDSRIGELSPGLRKRLAIASELVGDVSVLLVDEPTAGLDNFTGVSVVSQLKYIASREAKTVVVAVSKPSSEVFATFDKILLLGAGGKVVYHGSASSAAAYFVGHGHHCPPQFGTADFLVSLASVSPLMPSLPWKGEGLGIEDAQARVESLAREWESFRLSDAYKETLPPRYAAVIESGFDGDSKRTKAARSPTPIIPSTPSVAYNFAVLARRNIARLRSIPTLRLSIIQPLVSSVVIGLIYFQPDMDQRGVQTYSSIFFVFIVGLMMMNAVATLASVPLELAVATREHRAGLNHLMWWYLAKNVTEIPLQIVQPMLFILPVYFLASIGHGVELFFYIAVILILVVSTAVGYGYMMSCLLKRMQLALPIGIALLVPMLVIGGVLVNPKTIRDYLAWFTYLSPFKYSYEAQMNLFWSRVDTISCFPLPKCTATTGMAVLRSRSLLDRTPWTSGLLLLALNAGFRLVGLIALLLI